MLSNDHLEQDRYEWIMLEMIPFVLQEAHLI